MRLVANSDNSSESMRPLEELAVQAVISELVSAVFSLFYGKIQGSSTEFSPKTTIDGGLRDLNSITYNPDSLNIGSGKLCI